jgi:D-beta-D-heptose 7-phosphate kinase/D-beta-D-heptose 1-phosphate adenosyltransferase
MRNLKVLLEEIARKRVLVVGDLMLDSYWWGNANRISPEAPVPVLELQEESVRLGGAANVALNLAGLGAKVGICSLSGEDAEGEVLRGLLVDCGIDNSLVISDPSRPTTVKRRMLANNHQLLRVDRESTHLISSDLESKMVSGLARSINDWDFVVVSDYAKGLVSPTLMESLVGFGIPIYADPKGSDYSKYRGCELITPNLKEFRLACATHQIECEEIPVAALNLIREIGVNRILITRGSDGMTLVEEGAPVIHRDATARNVYDVTGAGDTVIATFSAVLSSGGDSETAVEIANEAAGVVVESVGTTAISKEILVKRVVL